MRRIAIRIRMGRIGLNETGSTSKFELRPSTSSGRPEPVEGRSSKLNPRQGMQLAHLWLFFDPSLSSSAIVSGYGEMRETGLLAMSAVVWPRRLTAFTSAPFDTKY